MLKYFFISVKLLVSIFCMVFYRLQFFYISINNITLYINIFLFFMRKIKNNYSLTKKKEHFSLSQIFFVEYK